MKIYKFKFNFKLKNRALKMGGKRAFLTKKRKGKKVKGIDLGKRVVKSQD